MKQVSFIAFIFMLIPKFIWSQNNIQSQDVFKIGSKYIVLYDNPDYIDIGAGGTGQMWDFRNSFTHNLFDTVDVLPSAANPVGNVAGNVAVLKNSGNISGTFYELTQQTLKEKAYKKINSNVLMNSNGDFNILQFPVQYGQNYSGSFRADNQFYSNQDLGVGYWVDSVRVRRHIEYTVNVDAEGTMKTDLGEYDVLRVKIYFKGVDTADFYNAASNTWHLNADIFEYDHNRFWFWSNEVAYPLAVMYDFVLANMVSDVEVLTEIVNEPGTTAIVSDESVSKLSVYPNPCTRFVHIEGHDVNSTWEIFDNQGAKIADGTQNTILTEHLPKGNYWLKLQENGKPKMKRFLKL